MATLHAARASILVVEDDLASTAALVDALEMQNYRVWHALNGAEARSQTQRMKPDLILLDLMLPDIDGLVLCTVLKTISDVPIIICTASTRRGDAVLGLKLGADDFVRKPFDLDDLLARIEAVLRRTLARQAPNGRARSGSTALQVGELIVEPARRRALIAGESLSLTPIELRLLTLLVTQSDAILSRDYLAHEVWGFTDLSNRRTIDVHIRRLRMKLAGGGVSGPSIISVRGMGYRIAANETANTAA